MIFHEFGDKKFPHILLIHGGGNSWWNYLRQARILSDKYHVILPTLNGHGEEYQKEYISTENSAQQIMDYIKNNCDENYLLWVVFLWEVKLPLSYYR